MNDIVYGINVDYSRDELLDTIGHERLKDSYMMEGETSPQERYAYVSNAFSSNPEHAQRLYEYSSKHWLGYSTPILSFGRNKSGLPISCFTGDTEVNTEHGLVQMKDLTVGVKVLSEDGSYNEIEAIRAQESDDLYELSFEGEVFRVTGNHLILTQEDGWVRVDELDSTRHNIVKL